MELLESNPEVRVDAVELQSELIEPVWDLTYRQLSPGEFGGRMSYAASHDAILYREETSASVHISGGLKKGLLAFGFPSDRTTANSRWWHGNKPRDGLPFLSGSEDLDVILGGGSDTYVLIFKEDEFRNYFRILSGCDPEFLDDTNQFVETSEPSIDEMRRIFEEKLASTLTSSKGSSTGSFQADLIEIIASRFFPSGRTILNSSQRRGLVRRAVEAYERLGYAVSMAKLCVELHCCKRTLEYAFHECLGMSPSQYFRTVRLNCCRIILAHSDPREITVRSVAEQFGFPGPGPFAASYRQHFGEHPSSTLNRPLSRVKPIFSALDRRMGFDEDSVVLQAIESNWIE